MSDRFTRVSTGLRERLGSVVQEFHRIRRLPPYVFEAVNRLKAEARGRGDDIVDFGMGNPDLPTPQHIIDKLVEKDRDARFRNADEVLGYLSRKFYQSDPAKPDITQKLH